MQRGNLLWESSRMILPEHRRKVMEYRNEVKRKTLYQRPNWDEQQLEEFQRMLSWAIGEHRQVTLRYYTKDGPRQIEGMVIKIDTINGKILIQSTDTKEAINIKEILAITG